MNESIPLSQKLYLLGIHPQKGGIIGSSITAMNYVLVGSLLLELYQNKNITFENKKIVVLNSKTEIKIHRFLLEKLSTAKSPLKIARWINKLHLSSNLIKKDVQNGLVEKRIIRMQPQKFLFFKWQKPVIINKQVVFHLLSDIENQVFGGNVNEEEIILLSFIKPAGLLSRIFPEREKRKKAKAKLNRLMAENQVSAAVADAISAAQAVAASVAATTAATAASS